MVFLILKYTKQHINRRIVHETHTLYLAAKEEKIGKLRVPHALQLGEGAHHISSTPTGLDQSDWKTMVR